MFTNKKRVFYKGNEDQETAIINESQFDEFNMTVKDWKNL